MDLHMKLRIMESETNQIDVKSEDYASVLHDVTTLINKRDKLTDVEINIIFNRLVQTYFPLLVKYSKRLFRQDRLIDKNNVYKKTKYNEQMNPMWNESMTIVVGFFWEFILKYKPEKGVYFTHYLKLMFQWRALNLWKTLARVQGYSTKKIKRKRYKEVSYDELTEINGQDDKPRTVNFDDITFDDNFEKIVFEWAQNEPVLFVENETLFHVLSRFTEKQNEVFTLKLQSYTENQITKLLSKKHKKKITQQAVNERMIGVNKKIQGVEYEAYKQTKKEKIS